MIFTFFFVEVDHGDTYYDYVYREQASITKLGGIKYHLYV